jgi:hypothetical protein
MKDYPLYVRLLAEGYSKRGVELQNAIDMLHHALDWCGDDVRRGEIPPADILKNRYDTLLACVKKLPPSSEELGYPELDLSFEENPVEPLPINTDYAPDLLTDAAPDLLVALKAMLRSFETGEHYETRNPYSRPYVKEAIAAIAKAEGRVE